MVKLGIGIAIFEGAILLVGIALQYRRIDLVPISKRYPTLEMITSICAAFMCITIELIPALNLTCASWLIALWFLNIGVTSLITQIFFVYTDFAIRDNLVRSSTHRVPESTLKMLNIRKKLTMLKIVLGVTCQSAVVAVIYICLYFSAQDFFDQPVLEGGCRVGSVTLYTIIMASIVPCIPILLVVKKKFAGLKESYYIKRSYVIMLMNCCPSLITTILHEVFRSDPEKIASILYIVGCISMSVVYICLYYPVYLSYTVFERHNMELKTQSKLASRSKLTSRSIVSLETGITHYSFEDIITDGVLLNNLKDFMTAEFSVENLMFILTVDRCINLCSEHNTESIQLQLRKLKSMFLEEEGILCVNLSSASRRDAILCVDQMNGMAIIQEDDLGGIIQARREIKSLIARSILPRFRRSLKSEFL